MPRPHLALAMTNSSNAPYVAPRSTPPRLRHAGDLRHAAGAQVAICAEDRGAGVTASLVVAWAVCLVEFFVPLAVDAGVHCTNESRHADTIDFFDVPTTSILLWHEPCTFVFVPLAAA